MSEDRELRDLVERLQTENAQLKATEAELEASRAEVKALTERVEHLWRQLELADAHRARRDTERAQEREFEGDMLARLVRDLGIANQEHARLRNLLDSARLEIDLLKRKPS